MSENEKYCLPQYLVDKFSRALDGPLDPENLVDMSSSERRKAFEEILGEDHAEEVNILFEQKLLLKNQQKGIANWIATVQGIKPQTRLDMLSKIQRMKGVLTPAEKNRFLADLAKDKLGFNVTADEAQLIFDQSTKVKNLQAAMEGTKAGSIERIAYGRAAMDFKDLVSKMKPGGRAWTGLLGDILNISRTVQTSLDLSAVLNQGTGMLSRKEGLKGIGQMFKYMASEENYKNFQAYVLSHPNYALMQDGKLAIMDLSDKLSLREEEIQSSLVEKFNQKLKDASGGLVPNIIRGSNRAYTGYLNYVRVEVFNNLVESARAAGEDVRLGSKTLKDIAKSVNDFTGRGNLGKDDKYGYAGPLINIVLYAPRKISATVNMLNPLRYMDPKISLTARKAAFRQLLGTIGVTTAALTLAKAMGADVNINDPTASDFLSVKVGSHSVDFTGGVSTYLKFLGRFYNNSLTTASGKELEFTDAYGSPSRGSLTANFMRNKLAPVASFIVDALFQKDSIGRPFDITQEAKDRLVPMGLDSILDYFHTEPEESTKLIFPLLSVFGSNLSSPLPAESKFGINVWAEPSTPYDIAPRNAIDKEAFRLGVPVHLPPSRISGIKLTDQQYQNYIMLSGQFAKQQLEPLITSPAWGQMNDGFKTQMIKSRLQQSRTFAQETIKAQSLGSDNDIERKSREARLEQFQ